MSNKETKQKFEELLRYQDSLSEKEQDKLFDNFEKYESFYDDEDCCDETFELLEDGYVLFTWTYTDYDGPQYGRWFKVKAELLK
jgi:hypothetical protein